MDSFIHSFIAQIKSKTKFTLLTIHSLPHTTHTNTNTNTKRQSANPSGLTLHCRSIHTYTHPSVYLRP
ncbi:hypothetical protein CEP51_012499 [Fusarium floridanum]|uniref:Uncharacterized protein n=1 Tax=Fusarium floridanum TaxID=1325733 RepID=A0A428QT91_9HYPO|nr:hypothetical protein CEP51_012499 [Fusarium floridanum]